MEYLIISQPSSCWLFWWRTVKWGRLLGVCGLIYLRSWSTVNISSIFLWAESYRYLIVFMSYLRIQTSHDLTDLTDRWKANTSTESDKANSQMLFGKITSSHSSWVDLADPTISKAVLHFNHANGLLQVYRIFQNLKKKKKQ